MRAAPHRSSFENPPGGARGCRRRGTARAGALQLVCECDRRHAGRRSAPDRRRDRPPPRGAAHRGRHGPRHRSGTGSATLHAACDNQTQRHGPGTVARSAHRATPRRRRAHRECSAAGHSRHTRSRARALTMPAILIIEDEAILAKNVRTYLQRQGYEARVAPSAEAGLTALDEFSPDAVLVDYNLPGMNGLALLAELKRRDPSANVIMLTGHASVQVAVDAMKQGAADFLGKPVALDELKLVLD